MNAVATTAQKPVGVLAAVAGRYQMDPDAFKATVKGTVFPSNGSPEELAAFLVVANEYQLNPLTREIYAFPKRGGGIVPIVSIDGWISLVNSHPSFKGMELDAVTNDKGALVAYTCRIWRKDREMPTVITEYLDECIRSTDPWKMKHRMLRHKALIQCARYAFGFSGIYDEDEGVVIADAEAREVQPKEPRRQPPAPPKQIEQKAADPAPTEQPRDQTKAEPTKVTSGRQQAQPKDEPAQSEQADAYDGEAILSQIQAIMDECHDDDALEAARKPRMVPLYDKLQPDDQERVKEMYAAAKERIASEAEEADRAANEAAAAEAGDPVGPDERGHPDDDAFPGDKPSSLPPADKKPEKMDAAELEAHIRGYLETITDAEALKKRWYMDEELREILPEPIRKELRSLWKARMDELRAAEGQG